VEYASVEEAKAVVDKQQEVVLDGCNLFVGYSYNKTLQGL